MSQGMRARAKSNLQKWKDYVEVGNVVNKGDVGAVVATPAGGQVMFVAAPKYRKLLSIIPAVFFYRQPTDPLNRRYFTTEEYRGLHRKWNEYHRRDVEQVEEQRADFANMDDEMQAKVVENERLLALPLYPKQVKNVTATMQYLRDHPDTDGYGGDVDLFFSDYFGDERDFYDNTSTVGTTSYGSDSASINKKDRDGIHDWSTGNVELVPLWANGRFDWFSFSNGNSETTYQTICAHCDSALYVIYSLLCS
jgi:hypothetical protein